VFPPELALVLPLVVAPFAALSDFFGDDQRLIRPVARLIDIAALRADVPRCDPVRAWRDRHLPAAGHPIPSGAVPMPETRDPDIVLPGGWGTPLVPKCGRTTCRVRHFRDSDLTLQRDRCVG